MKVVGKCNRCGHSILQSDIDNNVANRKNHKVKLCKLLDSDYGRKKKW